MTTTTFASPRERLWREFATYATTSAQEWHARTWARAVLLRPELDDAGVVTLLASEWDAFRTARCPEGPAIAFRPPPHVAEEPVRPEPPRYDLLVPLQHGRYGLDLPAEEAPF